MPYMSSSSVVVKAPLSKAWDALTKPELVKKYFFGTNLETSWEVGSPIYFKGEWQGKSYEDKGVVLEFNPMKSLSYNYWSPMSGVEDKPELYQILRYDVEEVPEGVKITISQSNVETQETADHSAENWKSVLDALKKLVEEA